MHRNGLKSTSRRRFLIIGCGAVAALCAGCQGTATPISTGQVEPDGESVATVLPSVTPLPEGDGVPEVTRCPKGLVNDPYPGKCRRYIDENYNGYCDLSEVSV